VFEIIVAGGWVMIPIIGCSILALAICLERFWALRTSKVAPQQLMGSVWQMIRQGGLTADKLAELQHNSPLGRILVAGLNNANSGRDRMKESIQEVAGEVVHELERFLTALGTIAATAPLIGLLGTVIGMIKVFSDIVQQGTGNAGALAGGISEALITTAAGLAVAIPSLICHRHLQRKVDGLVVTMEQEAVKLVAAIHGEREIDD